MITNSILNVIGGLMDRLISMLPAVPVCSLDGMSNAIGTLGKIIGTISIFFPYEAVVICIGLLMMFELSKIVMQTIIFFWF